MGSRKQFGKRTGQVVTSKELNEDGSVQLQTFVPWTVVKPVAAMIIAPAGTPAFTVEANVKPKVSELKDSPLLRALGLGHYWRRLLSEGVLASAEEIARVELVDVTRVRRLLQLSLLSPEVIEYLMNCKKCGLEQVIRNSWPSSWVSQRARLRSMENQDQRASHTSKQYAQR